MRLRRAVTAALSVALAAVAAQAALYKWTDANGRVVYSDQPPPPSVKSETIAAPPPPANPNAAKELANKEADDRARKVQRAEEEAKAAKATADAQRKREDCGRVRGQVAMLVSEPNMLYRSNDQGQPVYMDEAARLSRQQQLEAWLRENCANVQ